ncbi:MAG: acetyl-CoA carboxylase biotin carboxyl carrier protein [Roseiflexaceae bacterium]|nr:acetyl-CoA carboxylase biotin carboxyl carrier protein [Roseiflexaceae bacterium]
MTEGAREQARPEVDDFGLNAVRELLQLLSQTDITEIQIERGGSRLHIKRSPPAPAPLIAAPTVVVSPTAAQAAIQSSPTGPSSVGESDHLLPGQSTITAPMVGTYYAAPSPKDKPYVEEGDIIQPGDRVGLVEAMKMMNEIESEVSGRIVRLLVKNGQPVEYGQVLMVVEPI